MERRTSMRLRHRSSDVVVVNGEGDSESDSDDLPSPPKRKATLKTVIVREYDILKSRVLLKEPELMLECEDDPLTAVQLRSNHMAKEAHAVSMRQIQAAHENRLTFDASGNPVIHDHPLNVQKATVNPFTSNGGLSLNKPMNTLRPNIPINKAPSSSRPIMMNTKTTPMANSQRYLAGNQSSPFSIPVQRVAAQPRRDVISGTYGLGVKRILGVETNRVIETSQDRMIAKQKQNEDDWVTLDEYYYGKKEGITNFVEEKGEFRFKCWYCNKMLYNNVKAMMHLQSHIDSEKQQNLDLRDLTQCKHCYKQFDTPFEMQTHIEKVHLTNSNILMCRICEKDHDSKNSLMSHMKVTHNVCEMPYICQICEFRSSMYGDVVDHFKKKHDSSPNLLCLYCLRVFKIKFVNSGWGSTQNFYHHLVKHQSKSRSKKCPSCKLAFLNPQETKTHQKRDHMANRRGLDTSMVQQEQRIVQPCGKSPGQCVKSLNAPAVMKNVDLSQLHIPTFSESYSCYECKQSMSNHDHFKNHKECSMCRYATSCSTAYANHMMSFHSGRSSVLNVTKEHVLPGRRYCLCGFSSRYGNKIANHMVFCFKRTCYSQKPDSEFPTQEDPIVPAAPRTGSSILDVLGLMKKQTAKRSSDEAPPTSQYESETFVGITTLGMAHRDAAANEAALDSDGDSDADYDVEEEVESDFEEDDDDEDYRPGGRFRKPPSSGSSSRQVSSRHGSINTGTMLVKMNFDRSKTQKQSPAHKNFGITQPLQASKESARSENLSLLNYSNFDKNSLSRDLGVKAENISRPNSEEEKVDADKLYENSENSSKSENLAKSSVTEQGSAFAESKVEVPLKADDSENKEQNALKGSQNSGTGSYLKFSENAEEILDMDEQSTDSKNIETSSLDNPPRSEGNSEKTQGIEGSEKTSEDKNNSKDNGSSTEMAKTDEAMDTSETKTAPITMETSDSLETTDQSMEVAESCQEQQKEDETEKNGNQTADNAQNASHTPENKNKNFENLSEKENEDVNSEKNEEQIQCSAPVRQGDDTNSQEDSIPQAEEESSQVDKLDSEEKSDLEEQKMPSEQSNETLDEQEKETEEDLPKTAEALEDSSKSGESVAQNESPGVKDIDDEEGKAVLFELKKDNKMRNDESCATSEKDLKSNDAKSPESQHNSDNCPQKVSDADATLPLSTSRQKCSPKSSESSKVPKQAAESEPSTEHSKDRPSSDNSLSKERPSDESRGKSRDRKSSESRDSRSHDNRRDSYGTYHPRSSGSDKADRRHSGSGHSRSHDHDHHSNRFDRDDKYREKSSSRYDDRGGRDYDRYDDRGHSGRDYGGHGNRDRDSYRDNHNNDRNRRDRDSQGSRHGRDGYHSSQRRDYN